MRLLLSVCTALLVLLVPTWASADESNDALAALVGVAEEPVDYVVLVDTSISMASDGGWESAQAALSALMGSLTDDDHVTLVTFDDGAETVWQGPTAEADTMMAALPEAPTGRQTDIGAAIDEAVTALGREGAANIAAVVLLTDGELDAAENSPYVTVDAPAWDALKARADEVTADRHVGAFAISLGPNTDANLLAAVFPEAEVATPTDVAPVLSGLAEQITNDRIEEALAGDLADPLRVTLSQSSIDGTTVTLSAQWQSDAQYLPLTVSGLRLNPAIDGANLIAPETIELETGAVALTQLQVILPGPGEWELGISGDVDTPLSADLNGIGLSAASVATSQPVVISVAEPVSESPTPTPTVAPPTPVVTEPASVPPWFPLAAGVVGLLILALLMSRWVARRRGVLDGSIAVLAQGHVADEFVVTGARVRTRRAGLKLAIRPAKNGNIIVSGIKGATKFRQALSDGEALDLGEDMELRYTAKRTRMLDMIGGPSPEETVPPRRSGS